MEHIDIINRIIEAEERARQMVEEANSESVGVKEKVKTGAGNVRENYFERAEQRLLKVREREQESADEQIAELDRAFDRDLKSIEDAFEQNRTEWVEKLFNMIVGQSA